METGRYKRVRLFVARFGDLNLKHWNLFRISCFEFSALSISCVTPSDLLLFFIDAGR
jgi:hypothetical protein